MIEIKPYIEHAVLVGLITPSQPEDRTKEYLDELAFLADTHGIVPVKRFTQRLDQPNTATYVGEGKLEEIRQYIVAREKTKECPSDSKNLSSLNDSGLSASSEAVCDPVDVVIFDDELSPRQIRNLEKAINHREKHPANVRVIDRTILILEIFLQRAQTSYAKTQVEMAHLQYMLPRLTRMWSHLDRQRGGGGTNRGMGETQIEADKRVIGQRIALLREQLKTIDKQMATQRQHRGKMVRVALVGYTNVGKSTLMNLLSKSDVFAENKLFATLDTTVRKVTIENLPFLLSDTVGFIRKLPHHLVESFKSTLDEVREADLLIHVVDISHPNFEEQYEVVEQTVNELLNPQTPSNKAAQPSGQPQTIVVFNKIDNFTYTPKEEDDLTPVQRENLSLSDLEKTWMARLGEDCVFISARNKDNIDALRTLMYNRVKAIHIQRYPYNDFLFQNYEE
ncbi:MAG: GTPase HflX [Paludibacteraceae bacterium]|nr:GTPase HflX [Paludibacteraceae bacterium]MBR4563044.1 GTPase HflX [Paludibacteraceae bacterium]